MKRKLLLRESLFANIFIFIGLAILYKIAVSFHAFDPFYKSFSDFKITDTIYSKFLQNETDTNIVIINIGKLERAEIAELINKIEEKEPKVIGLDALFEDLKDPVGDIALKEAFSNAKNLVLAAPLIKPNDENSHGEGHFSIKGPHKYFGENTYGNADFVAKSGGTYRHFKSYIEDEHHHRIPSFDGEIVKQYDKEAYSNLLERKKENEVINYKGNLSSFIRFDYDAVLDSTTDLSILKNRIVLLGYINERIDDTINDLEDIFFTPVNPVVSGRSHPDMKGVVMHANVISMILDGSYLNELPLWLDLVIAFIVCFFHVILFMYYYVEKHKWFHLVAKIVQVITSILFVWIVFLTYKNFNIEFHAKLTIGAILLSVDLIYFYDGFIKYIAQKFNYKSYLIEYHH